MSFQSFTFAAFLAAAVGGFYAVPKKGRLAVLLIFNILFFEWADPFAGIWLLSSVCLTWGCALLVEKRRRQDEAPFADRSVPFFSADSFGSV